MPAPANDSAVTRLRLLFPSVTRRRAYVASAPARWRLSMFWQEALPSARLESELYVRPLLLELERLDAGRLIK